MNIKSIMAISHDPTFIDQGYPPPPFRMLYGLHVTLLVEIKTPTWRRENFNDKGNHVDLRSSTNLVEEVREMA